MTLIERLDQLAYKYPELETIESKTENIKERVHLMRRTEDFEKRAKEIFNFPRVVTSPTNEDIRSSHEELQKKMRSSGTNDLRAKLKGKQ